MLTNKNICRNSIFPFTINHIQSMRIYLQFYSMQVKNNKKKTLHFGNANELLSGTRLFTQSTEVTKTCTALLLHTTTKYQQRWMSEYGPINSYVIITNLSLFLFNIFSRLT